MLKKLRLFSFLLLFNLLIVSGISSAPIQIAAETQVVTIDETNYGEFNQIDAPESELHEVELIRIVDGDTIIVLWQGKEERVRFIGMDTPESVHPDKSRNSILGEVASDFLEDLLKQTDEPLVNLLVNMRPEEFLLYVSSLKIKLFSLRLHS